MMMSDGVVRRKVGAASPWTEDRKAELLKLYQGGYMPVLIKCLLIVEAWLHSEAISDSLVENRSEASSTSNTSVLSRSTSLSRSTGDRIESTVVSTVNV